MLAQVKELGSRVAGWPFRVAAGLRTDAGEVSRYGIMPGYRHRESERYFDDTALAHEWQREVYEFAADLMRTKGYSTVYDVGCGSGYKLIKYLGRYETTGFDVDQTVAFLKKNYPDRTWLSVPLTCRTLSPADLVICADVIEHVVDPDALLSFLAHVARRHIIISTPDRDLVHPRYSRFYYGPPRNPCHVREWTSAELETYLSQRFEVLGQRITNEQQGTQMVLLACR